MADVDPLTDPDDGGNSQGHRLPDGSLLMPEDMEGIGFQWAWFEDLSTVQEFETAGSESDLTTDETVELSDRGSDREAESVHAQVVIPTQNRNLQTSTPEPPESESRFRE